MNKRILTTTLALALVSLGMSGTALAGKPGFEKCMGIVKAGKNDCGTSGHACAGTIHQGRRARRVDLCARRYLREDRGRQGEEVVHHAAVRRIGGGRPAHRPLPCQGATTMSTLQSLIKPYNLLARGLYALAPLFDLALRLWVAWAFIKSG